MVLWLCRGHPAILRPGAPVHFYRSVLKFGWMSCPDTTLVTDNIRAHQVPMDVHATLASGGTLATHEVMRNSPSDLSRDIAIWWYVGGTQGRLPYVAGKGHLKGGPRPNVYLDFGPV